jgi:virginiamycin B lyase
VTWNPAQMMGISKPTGITQGPDGAIWFTNAGNNSIGRITKSGKKVSSYTGPGISNPAGIAPGPDGALWFANHGSASLGRITIKINSSSRTGAPSPP